MTLLCGVVPCADQEAHGRDRERQASRARTLFVLSPRMLLARLLEHGRASAGRQGLLDRTVGRRTRVEADKLPAQNFATVRSPEFDMFSPLQSSPHATTPLCEAARRQHPVWAFRTYVAGGPDSRRQPQYSDQQKCDVKHFKSIL